MSDVGFYPTSIGTSLAIEGLNGEGGRVDTNKGFDTKRFGALFVNLRLLVSIVTGKQIGRAHV